MGEREVGDSSGPVCRRLVSGKFPCGPRKRLAWSVNDLTGTGKAESQEEGSENRRQRKGKMGGWKGRVKAWGLEAPGLEPEGNPA